MVSDMDHKVEIARRHVSIASLENALKVKY